MLEQFFHSRSRIRALRAYSDGTLLDGFAQALWDAGYAEYTARKRILAASHVLYWARTRGIPSDELEMRMLARFDDHLKGRKCKGFDHTDRVDWLCAARSFLKYRCGNGVDPWRAGELEIALPTLLQEFSAWMREQRGTGQSTLNGYRAPLRELLKRIGEDPSRLDAPLLRRFILEQSQRMALGAAKNYATAVRMFLRFLITQGLCRSGLEAAVPVLAHWRRLRARAYSNHRDVLDTESCYVQYCLQVFDCKRDRLAILNIISWGMWRSPIRKRHGVASAPLQRLQPLE